jgi:hypothetical protein
VTRKQTPAERLALASKNITLDEIVAQSKWSLLLVEQAVFLYGLANNTFSANDLRGVLPEMGHGFLGAAINSLRCSGLIQHTGQVVPSTLDSTHGHRIAVWQFTDKGIAVATRSRAARREQAA